MANKHHKSDMILERLLSLHPKLIDLGLERMERLLGALGNPHHKLPPIIHIAGTNGKGSVTAFLRAFCESHNLRAHIYNSPHLCWFHERIILQGDAISESQLQHYLEICETANQGAPITFFEITTAAAFLAFAEIPADILILEVGLGGRLDATNVIGAHNDIVASVITPIGLDHQQYLGETLPEITFEKGGIMKKGGTVICAQQLPEAEQVLIGQAKEIGVRCLQIQGRDFDFRKVQGGFHYHADNIQSPFLPAPSLSGAHQYQNATLAMCAFLEFYQRAQKETRPNHASEKKHEKKREDFDWQKIQAALSTVKWAARLQRIDHLWQDMSGQDRNAYDRNGQKADAQAIRAPKEIWLDGAHNEDGAKILDNFFQDSARASKKNYPIYVVLAMLDSKDSTRFLRCLQKFISGGVVLTLPEQNAARGAQDLATDAKAAGLDLRVMNESPAPDDAPTPTPDNFCQNFADALKTLPQDEDYILLITGSLYFAGYLLKTYQGDADGAYVQTLRRKLKFRAWHMGTRELDLLCGKFADGNLEKMGLDALKDFQKMLKIADRDLQEILTHPEIDVKHQQDYALQLPMAMQVKNFDIHG